MSQREPGEVVVPSNDAEHMSRAAHMLSRDVNADPVTAVAAYAPLPVLPKTQETLRDAALRLAREYGSVHFVDADGNPVEPPTEEEMRTGAATSTLEAGDVEQLFGARVLARMDDRDTALGSGIIQSSQAHATVKHTGVVLAVSPDLEGKVRVGQKIWWSGARSSDFPRTFAGSEMLVVLRFPEEIHGAMRERVLVHRASGELERARSGRL